MKKRVMIPILLCMALLAGCQEVPEVSKDGEIFRAKGESEDRVEDILREDEGESAGENAGDGENVALVLGQGENCMRLETEIPRVPESLGALVMEPDESLDGETLKRFLEPEGETEDITQRLLEEQEAEEQRQRELDQRLGEGDSMLEMAGIGDGSYLALTDQNRRAILKGRTGVFYEDAALKEKCRQAAKKNEQELDVDAPGTGFSSFSLQDAEDLLKEKLSLLGIEDIYLYEADAHEGGGYYFYEVRFVPFVEGVPVAYSFGQMVVTEVYPDGNAWICPEGVADLSLENFCMEKASEGEKAPVLSWNKLKKLLETYLEDGSLVCREDVSFSTVELVYYPRKKEGELELTPMWNLHTDMGEYVDYAGEHGMDTVWNIYLNAVTGELEEVQ